MQWLSLEGKQKRDDSRRRLGMEFEWDAAKALSNLRKHRVSFDEALTVFDPAQPEIFEDEFHSGREARFLAVGLSDKARMLTVSFVRREGKLRIISARASTRHETNLYGQAKSQKS
jgi:uncharacterized protein